MKKYEIIAKKQKHEIKPHRLFSSLLPALQYLITIYNET